jgi:CMP-N-acetylneuraminic acid synthetase
VTFSNILFIIPARKDSVRLKNKNIRKIGGKTLVQHSIDFVLKLKISILNVIISTNSEKIIKIAKKNHILFIKRKKKLSTKNAKSEDVILDAIYWYKKNYLDKFKKIKAVVLLQPTYPFRSYKIFSVACKFFFKKKLDNVFSATPTKERKRLIFSKNNQNIKPNGNFYITRLKFFLKKKDLFLGYSYGCILKEKKLLIDIDTFRDYIRAQNLYKKIKGNI